MLALVRNTGLEEAPRVQLVIAMKFPRRSVKLVAARLGDHAHLGARVVSELRRERRRLDADFLDRIRRRRIEPGGLREVREVGPIQREIVLPSRRSEEHTSELQSQ